MAVGPLLAIEQSGEGEPLVLIHGRGHGPAGAEATERHAARASFLSATAYGVGGMIEDYRTYSACRVLVDPDEGHHFFRRRLEEIMTVLLKPEQGPESLSVAGARAMLAARTPSIETDGR